MKSKDELRKKLLLIRSKISGNRRRAASAVLIRSLYSQIQNFSMILSFASKKDEIDLWQINEKLAKEGRLLLPKLIDDSRLLVFSVKNVGKELMMNQMWKVLEPNPKYCNNISLDLIDCVLVPGVGFDSSNHRIGYGKGCYDFLLAGLNCPFYGVGFKEQYLTKPIPSEPHDIPLTKTFFF